MAATPGLFCILLRVMNRRCYTQERTTLLISLNYFHSNYLSCLCQVAEKPGNFYVVGCITTIDVVEKFTCRSNKLEYLYGWIGFWAWRSSGGFTGALFARAKRKSGFYLKSEDTLCLSLRIAGAMA